MPRPLVSVVIPVYNGERYLAFALDSVFRQDYRPIEVVVVDDGSVDGSADIARSYEDVRYIYQTNNGPGLARNVGISASKGEFIAFLDADDLWAPNKLSLQIDYMLERPHVGYTLARQQIFLDSGTHVPPWLRKDLLLKDQVGFLPSALVARKTVFEQIGFFDSTYRIGDDADWFLRAKDAEVPMAVLPEILLFKRTHGANLSSHTETTVPELLRIVKASIDRQRQSGSTKG